MRCQICGAAGAAELERFPLLYQATSDNKAWGPGGRKWVCDQCGCVQSRVDAAWLDQAGRIYDGYLVHQLPVFGASGQTGGKFATLVEVLDRQPWLPAKGSALNVACGEGQLLAELSRVRPGWTLYGQDIDAKYAEPVERLGGAFSLELDDVPSSLDLLLCTDLEHLPDPATALASFWRKLGPEGILVLLVTDFSVHHCQLLIAEECTHFTAGTVAGVARQMGFEPLPIAGNSLPPRYALLCARKSAAAAPPRDGGRTRRMAEGAVDWLLETADEARRQASLHSSLGIFGAAVTGCWLFQELGPERVGFFVDEDATREPSFFGRPILAPREVPSGSVVFVPFPDLRANQIAERLAAVGVSSTLAPASRLGQRVAA
ncbi:MAG TPA: methyltransferase domain-containing protein [Chloroflexota bacterium]